MVSRFLFVLHIHISSLYFLHPVEMLYFKMSTVIIFFHLKMWNTFTSLQNDAIIQGKENNKRVTSHLERAERSEDGGRPLSGHKSSRAPGISVAVPQENWTPPQCLFGFCIAWIGRRKRKSAPELHAEADSAAQSVSKSLIMRNHSLWACWIYHSPKQC